MVDGATGRQSTYTTPSGTYTITEGFGVEAGGTSMPYTQVNSAHWWVEDPESTFYNSMHTTEGADFPLVETGERGSERLINYLTQYTSMGRARPRVVYPCRAIVDRIMAWIKPPAHARIASG